MEGAIHGSFNGKRVFVKMKKQHWKLGKWGEIGIGSGLGGMENKEKKRSNIRYWVVISKKERWS